jgi:hypothetical protein
MQQYPGRTPPGLRRVVGTGFIQARQGAPGAIAPGVPVRPELADLSRLGRRFLRQLIGKARAEDAPSLPRSLTDHLGPDAASLPVVGEIWPAYEHVNIQIALDHWLAADSRHHTMVGITGFQNRMFSLADLAQPLTSLHGPFIGSVALSGLPSGPGGETHSCVRCGLYLVSDETGPAAILLKEAPSNGRQSGGVAMEVLSAEPHRAETVLAELRALALLHNIYRGHVLSFDQELFGMGPPGETPLSFVERPQLSRDALVLPQGLLELVERQVIGIAEHRGRLLASGQHLKRGILLHGPPGTGKTHTVRYLLGRLTDVTIVILSGSALRLIGPAASIARSLQPSVIVVEDVDLIAEGRGMSPGQHPLLFQLLNEMDGLGEDADVAFLLTTNRADMLEPALAARPGRVDQAVEIPLPDADGRRRLIELYRGQLELADIDLDPVVARTEGVTASFIKELLRRAALVAADRVDTEGDEPLSVWNSDLDEALNELLAEKNRLTRILLGNAAETDSVSAAGAQARRGMMR